MDKASYITELPCIDSTGCSCLARRAKTYPATLRWVRLQWSLSPLRRNDTLTFLRLCRRRALCSCAGARPALFGMHGGREGERGGGGGSESKAGIQRSRGGAKVIGHTTREWLQRERFAAFNCGASPSSHQPLTVQQQAAGGATAPACCLLRSQRPRARGHTGAYRGQTWPLRCDEARSREPSPAPLPTPPTARAPGGEGERGKRERGTGTPRGSRWRRGRGA